MIYDTDILIWVQRGNAKAARLIDRDHSRQLSVQSYMELLQGAKNKTQHRVIRSFLHDCNFTVLPLSENIGHRASIYVEEFALSDGMRAADAIIAATAAEHNLELVTSNDRHFKVVKDIRLKVFRP